MFYILLIIAVLSSGIYSPDGKKSRKKLKAKLKTQKNIEKAERIEQEVLVQYNKSIGYTSGKTVIQLVDRRGKLQWFIDEPALGDEKKIICEHMLNVYCDAENGSLAEGVPAFVCTQDGMWYKIDDPPPRFRKFIFHEKPLRIEHCLSPYLEVEDFKPAKLKVFKGYFVPESYDCKW